ncbi:MAG TPA: hypothetical protein VGT82_15320, partial [Ktedonobacteraceae bacterium]|nr:hypothetical protein [Ktedonobacteraceae bacterium]
TFWTGEGFGVTWPFSDLFLLILAALYLLASFVLVTWLKQVRLQHQVKASTAPPVTNEQEGVRP